LYSIKQQIADKNAPTGRDNKKTKVVKYKFDEAFISALHELWD